MSRVRRIGPDWQTIATVAGCAILFGLVTLLLMDLNELAMLRVGARP